MLAYCCNEYRPPDVDGRRELLDALVKAFAERGIGGRSLREIADAVSTNHRMLLHHFSPRSELHPDAVDDWLADADAVTGGTIDSAFSRLGLAVIRGLLLDLVATDDDVGVDAAVRDRSGVVHRKDWPRVGHTLQFTAATVVERDSGPEH